MPRRSASPEPPSTEAGFRTASPSPKRFDSRDLLGEAGIALIAHDGEVYSLRRTRLGRLILTK